MPRPRVRVHDLETVKLKGRSLLGWQTLAWTAAAALCLYLFGLGNHVLWDYHEPYVGGIVREMADSGDWIVPTLNGAPYLEKPPLFYVLGALVCRIAGSFEPWALRLPSALLAVATVGWVAYLGWRVSSARAGGWAGFMTATSVLFFQEGHSAVVDMTLTAAVSLALGCAHLALLEPPYRDRWVRGFWIGLGLAFLAKGVFGVVVVVLPLALALGLKRDRDSLRAFLAARGSLLLAVLLALAWIVPLALRGGWPFLEEVFLRNTLGRFLASPGLVPRTGRLGEHVEPVWFYLERLPGNLLPWLPAWAVALAGAWPRRGAAFSYRTGFLPLAFATTLLLLSVSAEKRMVYLLPLLPLSFLHAALWMDLRMPRRRARAPRTVGWVLGATLAIVALLGAGSPWLFWKRAQMPEVLAVALCLASVAMSLGTLVLLRQRRLARAVDATMAQWTVCLVLVLVYAVPELDREWRPILEPYALARRLQGQGVSLHAGRLSETQLGYASLEFRAVLPTVDNPEDAARLLARPGPAVLLAEPKHYWRGQLRPAGVGREWPTAASRSWRLWDRAPALVLNPAAWRLLDPASPAPPAP